MTYLTPISAATVNLAATTSSSRVALPTFDEGARTSIVYNAGSGDVFIEFGDSTVTASTTADMPIPAGIPIAFDRGGASHVAAIYGSGAGTVYFTPAGTHGI